MLSMAKTETFCNLIIFFVESERSADQKINLKHLPFIRSDYSSLTIKKTFDKKKLDLSEQNDHPVQEKTTLWVRPLKNDNVSSAQLT